MAGPSNDSNMRQRFKPPANAPKASDKQQQQQQQYRPQPPKTPPFQLNPRIAFAVLFAAHAVAALYHPIQDCDETFNYWEPTHYLTHGHGFQTWEYSPEYAIRSWAYVGLHALVTLPVKLLGLGKSAEFYFLRLVLGFVCALCEARLFSKINAALNPRIGLTFLLVMASSPGMWHASISYLPSSFAMYFVTLGIAGFMDWRGGLRTAQGIWMFGIAGTLGWPFAAALSAPFLFEEFSMGVLSDEEGMVKLFWRVVDGITRTLLIMFVQTMADAFFYKKTQIVPWNIVAYNIFSSKGGPDLYGTEPWHFYLRNLTLNFHVWFLLALISMPLLVMQHTFRMKGNTRASYFRSVTFLSPFYLWLAIFTLQPHKEERFMYPAYPALAVNAAISLHIILGNINSTDPKDLVAKIPFQLRLGGLLLFCLVSFVLSGLRIAGAITAYNAPLNVYKPLHNDSATVGGAKLDDFVCLGKEWYRFPSHYFLPEGVRAKFIKSEFSGLLPGEFSEAGSGFGLFPGAWLIPPGMNDENIEDVGKYTEVKHCAFVVDSQLPSTKTTPLEPSYAGDEGTWERAGCQPFLDGFSTTVLGRTLWVPDLPLVPEPMKRVWGEYCLLKRKKKASPERERLLSVKAVPYVLLALAALTLLVKYIKDKQHLSVARPRSPDPEKPTDVNTFAEKRMKDSERKPGTWTPSNFKRPEAPPYPDWSVTDTKPLPYRPFRWGPYHITMGLRSMNWDEWIELDNHYLRYHEDKARRIAERGAKCCRTDPDPKVWDAAVELLEELSAYLTERYPSMFTKTDVGIDNTVTNESFNIPELTMNGNKEDPMQLCARLVQDDLAIMIEKEDGQYYLLAGAILLAGFWRLEDKFGMCMSEIHTSGDVPGFKSKLEKGMMNFFRRVKPESPVLRNNYFMQVDDSLPWSHSIGSEDAQDGIGWYTAEKNRAIKHHFFRSERQSLRRLPRSGGVVFTIRTYFLPVTEIAEEPYVPGRLASAVRSWGDDVAKYKGREQYQDVLLEFLDKKHEEQVASGLDLSKEEEVRTYPW
ncbi:glycosyltransferase family 22 protein [Hortaea werneckii]|nr:glycosyltransferase family 22 protein [Hortaea werneckii]